MQKKKKVCEHESGGDLATAQSSYVNVIQNGAFVNAYCTMCGVAANLHIDNGGRELLLTAAVVPVVEKEYKKESEEKPRTEKVRFDTSELENV